MRLIFISIFVFIASQVQAQDSLDVLFRAYNTKGKVLHGKSLISSGHWLLQTDEDAWQTVRIPVNIDGKAILNLVNDKDSIILRIAIHKNKTAQLRTLVIPRLQFGKTEKSIKINQLTCSWQGSIATALDYRFVNPLEDQVLVLISENCLSDTFKHISTELHVLSDSVMLIRCSQKQGVLLKYYVDSEGFMELIPSHKNCAEFDHPTKALIYRFFVSEPGAIQVQFDGYDVHFIRQRCRLDMRIKF